MSIVRQQGFNLVEILVTVAITTVGLLGISSLQLQSNRATQDSSNRSQAVWMLEDLANRMNANSNALSSYDTAGDYICNTPPTICADYYNGDRVLAAECSSQQIALFDIWDVACSRNYTLNGITVRLSPADFISNPVLNISVDTINRKATLSITWDVRTSGTDAAGNKLYIIDGSNDKRTDTLTRQVQL